MIYRCCDDRRRGVLEQQSVFNGIDFLEVVDNPSDPDSIRQRTLLAHFIHPLKPGQLVLQNVRIDGGERIRTIVIAEVSQAGSSSPAGDPKVLVVRVQEPGDFSTYTLRLVDKNNPDKPPQDFDQVLSSIDFSFKVGCDSGFDCRQQLACPPEGTKPVDISYLAKDYASFRQLMLDRMAAILPQWQETSAADLGIMLVELLAYLGDYLSYQQDAVATEAYLSTARKRTSVRRHVRLVGYPMHDGRNARAWMHFALRSDVPTLTIPAGAGTQLFTKVSQPALVMDLQSSAYQQAIAEKPQIFELLEPAVLFREHNQISFYTWGALECCLPEGATTADLRGKLPNLTAGMVLVFREVKGPKTGVPGDADPSHAWAVRLTNVTAMNDPLGGSFAATSPLRPDVDVTRIEWAPADALPFPLCISSLTETSVFLDDVSVAYGNIALADQGLTIADEQLDEVLSPNPALTLVTTVAGDNCPGASDSCGATAPQPVASSYRPSLRQSPITFAESYDATQPASAAVENRALGELLPSIKLVPAVDINDAWTCRRDLLKSHAENKDFVVETEDDGTATLRFGDNVLGMAPVPGTIFEATYRVGNGQAGNIGADSIAHIASNNTALTTGLSNPVITAVSNPLPARGGLDPESLDRVRQSAPYAFRTQKRAVTEQDYGDIAQRCDSTIQRANATFRWTGSWRTAFIAADRKGGKLVDDTFRNALTACMEQYRMAGQDVDVEDPALVSLQLEMSICVKSDYFASDVERSLLLVLSNRVLPDGTLGAFHPDNFTFGQSVYLSPIIELVQQTEGVESVKVTKFQRQGKDSPLGLASGKLDFARLEIARLDNNPNFPEHGSLVLNMLGGR